MSIRDFFCTWFIKCKLLWMWLLCRESGGSKGGGAPGAPHPTDQNFLNFMQFFGKLGKNFMLMPPLEGWRRFLRKSWIRPCDMYYNNITIKNLIYEKYQNFKVCSHLTFFKPVSVIKCVLFSVIRITEIQWVHHPFCPLFTPSPLAKC